MGSPNVLVDAAPAHMADSQIAAATNPTIHRIWPPAVVVLGLGLTLLWTCVLGYGLIYLIKFIV
jgi:hypothetical protein